HPDLEPIVGIFVNTLAMRNFPLQDKTFRQFMGEVKENTLQALENQDYPFEDLVDAIGVKRDTSRNPLFDVSFQFNNFEMRELNIPGLTITPHHYHPKISKFDLTLWAWEDPAPGLSFLLEYSTELFKPGTMELIACYFQEIISAIAGVEEPGRALTLTLKDISRMPEAHKQQLLLHLNRSIETETLRLKEQGPILQHRLARGLEKDPDHIAIEYGASSLTYGELDRNSNRIAHALREKGCRPGTFTGVLMDHRMNLIVTLIGIMKAGGVFIPLDSSYPPDRWEVMIKVTGLQLLVIDSFNNDKLSTSGITQRRNIQPFIWNDLLEQTGPSAADQCPEVVYQPDDPLYIYFTSGSTGTPKAVMGKNQSLLHFLDWEADYFGVDQTFRVSQLASPGFDASLRDFLLPLPAGGVVCIPPHKDIIVNAARFTHWIDKSRIHLIHCVPSLFRSLASDALSVHHFKDLKFVLLGGERLNPTDLEQWHQTFGHRVQLANLYGPTETTLLKTCYMIQPQDVKHESISIGTPIRGTGVLILEEHNSGMEICDHLVIGECYIVTPYRTLGYYNEPQLTQQRFIRNPFSQLSEGILYKTGDLACTLPDGTLRFIGRIDRQVKVRGIRIEPGEIESALMNNSLIHEAVVVKKEVENANELLEAYIVSKGANVQEGELSADSIKEYLKQRFPDYMVPAKITRINHIPRNPNGKVDYNQLIALETEVSEYIAPQNEIQETIVSLWKQVLKTDKPGITDDFFQLGGNSLNIIMLIARIHKTYDILISLGDMFNNPTVKQLSEIVAAAQKKEFISVAEAEEKEYYVLSAAQKRIFLLEQFETQSKSTVYNMPQMAMLEGDLNRERLGDTFQQLIQRYESLRTS
ncbi:MAG: amino acid adenylation domain-containing protein, partial [bacterium]|nr:amino acid adenylation domain-containing protein [bacterium]